MKRVIFDTNIYGVIVEKAELNYILESMKGVLTDYGSVVVKQELKAYQGKKTIFHESKVRKLRSLLLEAYDLLVKKTYDVDEKTDRLAEEYFITYKKLGGKWSREKILNDFLIVATAALHDLEIVYTEEKEGSDKTMRSPEAIKAYDIVNELNNLNAPEFRSYEELKTGLRLKRWSA